MAPAALKNYVGGHWIEPENQGYLDVELRAPNIEVREKVKEPKQKDIEKRAALDAGGSCEAGERAAPELPADTPLPLRAAVAERARADFRLDTLASHPTAAALRETREEVGLDASAIELLGELERYETRTGFAVSPFVGLVDPRARARAEGLWCLQLSPENGGRGLGKMGMAVTYEAMNRSIFGPVVFNSAAPDDGNMMILEVLGTPRTLGCGLLQCLRARTDLFDDPLVRRTRGLQCCQLFGQITPPRRRRIPGRQALRLFDQGIAHDLPAQLLGLAVDLLQGLIDGHGADRHGGVA